MAKKTEVREGDRIQVWLEVTRVADEKVMGDQIVTVSVAGQRITAPLGRLHPVKTERGNNWPND